MVRLTRTATLTPGESLSVHVSTEDRRVTIDDMTGAVIILKDGDEITIITKAEAPKP